MECWFNFCVFIGGGVGGGRFGVRFILKLFFDSGVFLFSDLYFIFAEEWGVSFAKSFISCIEVIDFLLGRAGLVLGVMIGNLGDLFIALKSTDFLRSFKVYFLVDPGAWSLVSLTRLVWELLNRFSWSIFFFSCL